MKLDEKGLEAALDAFNMGCSIEDVFDVYLGVAGSVIVPVEPTDAMIDAANEHYLGRYEDRARMASAVMDAIKAAQEGE